MILSAREGTRTEVSDLSTEVLKQGDFLTIYAVTIDGKCEVQEFIDQLQESQRTKTIFLLERTANGGPPRNNQKFKPLENSKGLYEFKPDDTVRLICYQERIDYIVVLGVIKRGKHRPQDIQKAQRLRDQLIESTKGTERK